jgi:hypothetical protein
MIRSKMTKYLKTKICKICKKRGLVWKYSKDFYICDAENCKSAFTYKRLKGEYSKV